jgi:hypothetical protein
MIPNARGERGCGTSGNEYSCAHGTQRNFRGLTPYLAYALKPVISTKKRENHGVFSSKRLGTEWR